MGNVGTSSEVNPLNIYTNANNAWYNVRDCGMPHRLAWIKSSTMYSLSIIFWPQLWSGEPRNGSLSPCRKLKKQDLQSVCKYRDSCKGDKNFAAYWFVHRNLRLVTTSGLFLRQSPSSPWQWRPYSISTDKKVQAHPLSIVSSRHKTTKVLHWVRQLVPEENGERSGALTTILMWVHIQKAGTVME